MLIIFQKNEIKDLSNFGKSIRRIQFALEYRSSKKN